MAYFADLYADLKSFPRSIKLFYLGDIFFGFANSITATLFNLHLLQAGFTPSHIGTLQSVGALLTAVVAVPIGLMGDRFGRRWLYVLGALGFALPYAVMPFLRNFAAITVIYAIGMLFNTAMMVVESPLVAEEIGPDQRAAVFSFMIVNVTVWNTLAVKVAGWLVNWLPAGSISQYQWPLVVGGLCGLGCGLMRWITPFRPHRRRADAPALRLRPSQTALVLAVISVVAGAANTLLFSFTNVLLDLRLHFAANTISTVLTVAGVLGWAGSLLVPWVNQRVGSLKGYAAVFGLQAVVLGLMGLASAAVPFVAGLWVRQTLNTMQMALWSAFSMNMVAADERATANSWAIIGRNVGTAAASKGYGAAISAGQYGLSFGVAGLLAGATAALSLLTLRLRSAQPANDEVS